ncbi:hypothetical protein BH23GEM3_BH23GEM3_13800 [soil metagenome]
MLESCGRASDPMGRMGEYDFVGLAPNTDELCALRLAERLTRDLLVRATCALRRSRAGREGDRIRFFDASRA